MPPTVVRKAVRTLIPSLPTTITISDVAGRSAVATWSLDAKGIEANDKRTPVYYISTSIEDSGEYEFKYEGPDETCKVNGLIPLTHYTLKLRAKVYPYVANLRTMHLFPFPLVLSSSKVGYRPSN